jgi:hypothetical protein
VAAFLLVRLGLRSRRALERVLIDEEHRPLAVAARRN